jgi:broad specificity phosphatase PhoE
LVVVEVNCTKELFGYHFSEKGLIQLMLYNQVNILIFIFYIAYLILNIVLLQKKIPADMKIKTIYLIRHGETEYNRLGIVQGSGIDADLNEAGMAQASAFYNAYRHVKFDKIYLSNLKRTYQSVQGFIDEGLPFEKHIGLNEISWGEKEGRIPNYQDDVYYKSLIKSWQDGDVTLQSEGGESPLQVRERQTPVIEHILKNHQEETILIAMHGRAMRILLTTIFDQDLSAMDTWEHSNLCLYKLQYHYPSEQFELISANNTAHLSKEKILKVEFNSNSF